jgi:hypothetical protein
MLGGRRNTLTLREPRPWRLSRRTLSAKLGSLSSCLVHRLVVLSPEVKPKNVDPRYPALNPKYPLDCLLGHIFECTSTRTTPSKQNIPDNGPFQMQGAYRMPRHRASRRFKTPPRLLPPSLPRIGY